MIRSPIRTIALCVASALFVLALTSGQFAMGRNQAGERAMTVQYLEIVTPMVEETCDVLAGAHGVEFGDPIPEFGNARTASLSSGGRIGVRAPLRADEEPVVRPYVLVDDIEAAVEAAKAVGAEIAIPPMEIPGQGRFAIYLLGGIDHGLWER